MFSNFKDLKVLILGSSGFIGQHLSKSLHNSGALIRCYDLKQPAEKSLFTVSNNAAEWVIGDFTDSRKLSDATKNIDVIFHLISTTIPATSNTDLKYDLSSNVLPTLELLEAAKNNKVKKIVFISSGGTVYGQAATIPIPEEHKTQPICGYGIHKLIIEKYLFWYKYHHNLDFSVIRLANPYGEAQIAERAQGAIGNFIYKSIKKDILEIWGNGQIIRDYIYIEDAIEALILAAKYEGNDPIFNIGSGKGHSLLDIISIIEKISGCALKINFKESRHVDLPINILDISKAANDLGWLPKTNLYSGIQKIYKFGEENIKKN